MTRIVAISDTHAKSLSVLPKALLTEISDADIVVHCGDYTDISLLHELRDIAKKFIGVYGNVDDIDIRRTVPEKTTFEVDGRRIGVIHPYWGGAPFGIEEAIVKEFRNADLILFGHTHDAWTGKIDGVTFLNPGQAYSAFMEKATAGIVTVGSKGFKIEIVSF
jgi:putative phosphoesterase